MFVLHMVQSTSSTSIPANENRETNDDDRDEGGDDNETVVDDGITDPIIAPISRYRIVSEEGNDEWARLVLSRPAKREGNKESANDKKIVPNILRYGID